VIAEENATWSQCDDHGPPARQRGCDVENIAEVMDAVCVDPLEDAEKVRHVK
jgi:hypothetical protein